MATFLRFEDQGPRKMPVALVEFDEEIEMMEAKGLCHKGRFGLLKLRDADWEESETVTIHVVETLPANLEQFYATHPFGTEIESHAKYEIVK